jgi:hypothetical protein
MTNASGPNRGRRVSSTEIGPAVNQLDRANVKIDVGYGCVAAQGGMVLISQADFRSAGRAEDVGNDLPRDVLISGTHSHHCHDARFEHKLSHGVLFQYAWVKPIRPTTSQYRHVCTAARLQPVTRVTVCQIAAKASDEGGQSSRGKRLG